MGVRNLFPQLLDHCIVMGRLSSLPTSVRAASNRLAPRASSLSGGGTVAYKYWVQQVNRLDTSCIHHPLSVGVEGAISHMMLDVVEEEHT